MKLKRQLGLIHVFCIASGAMISSGIFILPGLAHAKAGPAVVFSYFFAGVLATMGLLSIAELTTAMPKAGGDYFYISRGLGPAAGTIAGLLSWFSLSLKSAFALIGMAMLIAPFIPVSRHIIAALLCIVFMLINLRGTKEAAGFQVLLVTALLGLMISFIVKGASQIQIKYFEPFTPYGLRSVFSTAGFVFVSYGGLIQVASIAGEIRNPGRNIPRGMIIAVVMMVILYTLMIFVTSGVLGSEELDNSLTPISDAAKVFWGRTGFILVSIAAALAFITTANAGIMTASRYLLAISKDELLPDTFSKISKKYKTPYIAIFITAIVILAAVFFNIYILAEVASIVFVLGYILANISIIILRESGLQNYRPVFRAPFYPWLQLVTIIGFLFVLLEMGEEAFVITAIIIFIGFLFYWFYGRKNVEKESALLHLVEKITAKELVTGTLEIELKEIIRERDDIAKDRFDWLIERCAVLDIEERKELDEFLKLASEEMSPHLGIEQSKLFDLLRKREKESSTVLSPELAIPHIVIDGQEKFDVLLVRAKKGIHFSDKYPNVHTVFILTGTKDERNFHLCTLSAIAQVVQEPAFEKKWMSAKNTQALRDIILLSGRKRFGG
ncbi:MAG: amino acid permease [Sedimentisphaerales bacterium]|nr:amino acid permease [Sedimentisphaerales bacterium]